MMMMTLFMFLITLLLNLSSNKIPFLPPPLPPPLQPFNLLQSPHERRCVTIVPHVTSMISTCLLWSPTNIANHQNIPITQLGAQTLISRSKMKNAWLISAILLWSTLPQAYTWLSMANLQKITPTSTPTLSKTKLSSSTPKHSPPFVPMDEPTDIPMMKRSVRPTPSSRGVLRHSLMVPAYLAIAVR